MEEFQAQPNWPAASSVVENSQTVDNIPEKEIHTDTGLERIEDNQDTLDDDFGDFGDFDDGFGEFESKETEFATFEAPVCTEPLFHNPMSNQQEEDRLAQLLDYSNYSQEISSILEDLKRSFPIPNPPKSLTTQQEPLLQKQMTGSFGEMWKRYQTRVYTDPFKWKKSILVQAFQAALSKKEPIDVPVVKEPQRPSKEEFSENDIELARQLSSIPPDIVSQKTKPELQEFIKQLQQSLLKVQEQTNYWMDAREQLLMDAEMHNKMIASLVTYAQQQQVKGAQAMASSKKKKK